MIILVYIDSLGCAILKSQILPEKYYSIQNNKGIIK